MPLLARTTGKYDHKIWMILNTRFARLNNKTLMSASEINNFCLQKFNMCVKINQMTLPKKSLDVVMIGSVPMSLNELALAPAMISSAVQRKGHRFQYLDINLELFNLCGRDNAAYEERVELLQGFQQASDAVIDAWQQSIIDRVIDRDVILINVFSHYSQSVALRLIEAIRSCSQAKILVGGIGSQKLLLNSDNRQTKQWIRQRFAKTRSKIFGQILLSNGLIDAWQSDASMTEIDRVIPTLPTVRVVDDVDFTIYDIDQYQWLGRKYVPVLGSHGCVRQCTFCDVIKHYPRYHFVEADALTKQIVSIYGQTGISKFSFMDSLVNGSMSNFEALLSNLAHSQQQGWLPEDFAWSGTYICRPGSTQLDRIHDLLEPSGAETLIIGVETGSDRIRFEMDKKFTNDDLIAEMSALSGTRVRAQHLFFPAWPTETQDDFSETLGLFRRLQPFALSGTLDSVLLGTSGFGLIDGTHIDRTKHTIGLEAGPTPFLWRCNTNPDLNFWESIRRRLAMSAYCEHLGISAANESTFARYLAFNLSQYRSVIRDYVGPVSCDLLDHSALLETAPRTHRMRFRVVNSSACPVTVTVLCGYQHTQYQCAPGTTEISWTFDKILSQHVEFCISIRFDSRHRPRWAQHDNGDYYDLDGVYLDDIWLDGKDITLWGFNRLVTQHIIGDRYLPPDYDQHVNQRCVSGDTDLRWSVAAGLGIHAHLLRTANPEFYQEYQFARQRLVRVLELHA